jgi:hypothetical protein
MVFFSTFNCKILYLTILLVCRNNCSQSNHLDCKIITIEGEETFLVGCPNCCQCYEIQQKLGGWAYNMPKYKNGKSV